MIIGVTGSYAAGKDSVAEILQKMGFYHISLSDMLREELTRRKVKLTREALISIGTELRTTYGPDVLARRAIAKLKDGENFVITSIRNPSEVQALQERPEFLLVNVISPIKLRLQRLQERNREEDPKTLQDLQQKEARENSTNPAGQQLASVASMARITIQNNGSLETLRDKVQQLVSDWLFKVQPPRPDWDHYFMNVAEQIKMRCSCLSPKKGALVAKDKMILSTGYNGSPKGIEHCTDGGCERCKARHLGKIKSGDYSLPCICCHAEENAIVQAAYNGTSTNGAILYTTFTPCTSCAKIIINAGIKEVVAKITYPDDVGTKLLEKAGVVLRVLK